MRDNDTHTARPGRHGLLTSLRVALLIPILLLPFACASCAFDPSSPCPCASFSPCAAATAAAAASACPAAFFCCWALRFCCFRLAALLFFVADTACNSNAPGAPLLLEFPPRVFQDSLPIPCQNGLRLLHICINLPGSYQITDNPGFYHCCCQDLECSHARLQEVYVRKIDTRVF